MQRVNSCDMPEPAPAREAELYCQIRDWFLRVHCADKRPAHRCAGSITIERQTITMQCPRCGDARQILTAPVPPPITD